jgi:hypothetical protein
MKLKLLAISDTHLGEESSLLTFPQGRQHLWQTLRSTFGSPDEPIEVDKAILLGDIPDRTLSSTSQIITHTSAFIDMLGSVASIRKGVYVPGNHDHTLWTGYLGRRYGTPSPYGITDPDGDLIVKDGERCDQNESASEVLAIFFGYPYGSSWRAIQQQKVFSFSVANPVYVTEINGRGYVFTHGAHFSDIVCRPAWQKELADYLQLDRILGHIEVESDCNVEKAIDLGDLERRVAPFMDSLWPSSRNNPVSQSDQLWYLLTKIQGKFGKKRETPPLTRLFAYKDSPLTPPERIRRLTPENGPMDETVERWQRYFLGHLLRYLEAHALRQDNISFVYGDTHDGGWGEVRSASGGRIRLYNCGSWVTHNEEDHPACHLFIVDNEGKEYLLDVSFKDVRVENDPLLKLAAQESEHRQQNSGILMKGLVGFEKLLDVFRPG